MIVLSIAGEAYEVRPLGVRPADAWREVHLDPFISQLESIENLPDLLESELLDDNNRPTDNWARFVPQIKPLLGWLYKSPIKIAEAVIAYSPILQQNADYLLDHGTADEFARALWRIISELVYPFGAVVGMAQAIGERSPRGTSESLPSPNGAGVPAKSEA